MRTTHILPCPVYQDILNLDTAGLKKLAKHGLRLEKNWSLPSPQILDNTSFPLTAGRRHPLFTIPGTHHIIWHEVVDGSVVISCFNAATGQVASCIRPENVPDHYSYVGTPFFGLKECLFAWQGKGRAAEK